MHLVYLLVFIKAVVRHLITELLLTGRLHRYQKTYVLTHSLTNALAPLPSPTLLDMHCWKSGCWELWMKQYCNPQPIWHLPTVGSANELSPAINPVWRIILFPSPGQTLSVMKWPWVPPRNPVPSEPSNFSCLGGKKGLQCGFNPTQPLLSSTDFSHLPPAPPPTPDPSPASHAASFPVGQQYSSSPHSFIFNYAFSFFPHPLPPLPHFP